MVLMSARDAVLAEQRLMMADAVGLAISRFFNGDNPAVITAGQRLIDQAYPRG